MSAKRYYTATASDEAAPSSLLTGIEGINLRCKYFVASEMNSLVSGGGAEERPDQQFELSA